MNLNSEYNTGKIDVFSSFSSLVFLGDSVSFSNQTETDFPHVHSVEPQ